MNFRPRYPGIRVTANGNQLVSYHTETRIADAGVFYPITPSTEGGELYQQAFAEGKLNVFGAQHDRRRGRRRARRAGRRDRALGVRQARRQLHVRARASSTASSSITTRPASARRWCWRWRRAR